MRASVRDAAEPGFELYSHGADPLVVGAAIFALAMLGVIVARLGGTRARRASWGVAGAAVVGFALWVGWVDDRSSDGWVTIVGMSNPDGVWYFDHEATGALTESLVVPVQRGVRLRLQSADGLRWFHAPGLGVTRVVGPGWEREVLFHARTSTEKACGLARDCRWEGRREVAECAHAIFGFSSVWRGDAAPRQCVEAISASAYDVLDESTCPPADPCPTGVPGAPCEGERVFIRNGCNACHSIDGTWRRSGPTLLGLFDSVRRLHGGTELVADFDYFAKSIVSPSLHIVEGYDISMPTYRLSPREVKVLAAYVRSLSAEPTDGEDDPPP